MLERADLPIRAAELFFYVPAFAVVAFLLFAVIVGPIAGLIAAAVVAIAPVRLRELPRAQASAASSSTSCPTP